MPEIAFNLGVALEASGRHSEAIAQYQRFLDEAAQRYPDRAEKVRESRLWSVLPFARRSFFTPFGSSRRRCTTRSHNTVRITESAVRPATAWR